MIAEYLEIIRTLATDNLLLAGLAFWLLYVTSVTLNIPGAAVLTTGAGAIFGLVNGTILAFTAAYVGAFLVFIAVKTFSANFFIKKIEGTKLDRARELINKNELIGLMTLRLLPIAPFFLVNILAGIVNMKTRNYLIGTLVMFPWTIAYVGAGAGLFTLFT